MRVVVDTNVLVRAFIAPKGSAGRMLTHLRQGAYIYLYSRELLEELIDVLNRPRIRMKYHGPGEDLRNLVTLLVHRGLAVSPRRRIFVCRDADDNKILEVAVAGHADVIVTEDRDLLVLHPFENVDIVTPAVFFPRLHEPV